MRTEKFVLRLSDRVFEVFATDSDYSLRLHADSVAFESRPPDGKGRVRVNVGRLDGEGLSLGSSRLKLDLDAVEWARFQAFVAVVKRVQDAGPEAW